MTVRFYLSNDIKITLKLYFWHENVKIFSLCTHSCYERHYLMLLDTVKPVLSGHSKRRPKIGFQTIIAYCWSKVLQNAPREHSAILSTFIKLPFVFKTFVLSIFE